MKLYEATLPRLATEYQVVSFTEGATPQELAHLNSQIEALGLGGQLEAQLPEGVAHVQVIALI